MKKDKKDKKSTNLIDLLKATIQPKKQTGKDRLDNHQPSWMYRNE